MVQFSLKEGGFSMICASYTVILTLQTWNWQQWYIICGKNTPPCSGTGNRFYIPEYI